MPEVWLGSQPHHVAAQQSRRVQKSVDRREGNSSEGLVGPGCQASKEALGLVGSGHLSSKWSESSPCPPPKGEGVKCEGYPG